MNMYLFKVYWRMNGKSHAIDYEVEAFSHHQAWQTLAKGFEKVFTSDVKIYRVDYKGAK